MRLSFFHLLILCMVSGLVGLFLIQNIPQIPRIKKNYFDPSYGLTSPEAPNSEHPSKESLLSLIKESDSTFSLEGFSLSLDRLDILCWLYRVQYGDDQNPEDCLVPMEEYHKNLVPNNFFYVIFGEYKFTFLNFLSVVSIRREMPDAKIYLVGDGHPEGPWWHRTLKEVPDIRIIYRTEIPFVFERRIKLPEHMSDIARMQILLLSGGIYLDPDIVLVKPIEELRHYDLTMGLMDKSTGMGNGLILAKPCSRFLTFWYQSYRTFDYTKWGVHSMKHPYLLSVMYPDLIHVEDKRIYSPNWFEIEKLFVKRVPWDNNLAVHIWHRHRYPLPKNFSDLAQLDTTLGEILSPSYKNAIKSMHLSDEDACAKPWTWSSCAESYAFRVYNSCKTQGNTFHLHCSPCGN